MPTFQGARLKIERANHHIEDLKWRIGRLEESCSAVTKVHPEFGHEVAIYDVTDKLATQKLSLIVGDAIHNLKCALDHGWIDTLQRHAPSAINDKTQFPIHKSRDALENALTDPKKSFNENLIGFVLTKIKPHPGGNEALCFIKELDIFDKHRLLLPMMHYAGFPGLKVEDESGHVTTGAGTATTLDPPWYVHIPHGGHVKEEGKPSITILFGEGTPTYYLDVVPHLELFSVIVRQVIETLEAFI